MISFARREQDIFEKSTENENYDFYDFFSSKAYNLQNKTLKILFFILYDITYIQNRGNGNNNLNLPIN